MLRFADRRRVVRSAHYSWPDDCDMTPRYFKHLTIDPSRGADAWEVLAEDTFPLEVATLPAFLHRALMREIQKRTKNGR